MLRALSLSPCESYSPTLLRTEPAYLASWIRYRLLQWLLGAPLLKTPWAYKGTHHVLIGGNRTTKIELESENRTLDIEYRFVNAGVEVGLPLPFAITQTLPSIKGTTSLWIVNGPAASNAGQADQDHLDRLGITHSCAVIDLRQLVDATVARSGLDTPRAVMLFGVTPSLRATLGRLSTYTRRLADASDASLSRHARYTPGILRAEWNPIDRLVGLDMRGIREDVEQAFSQHEFASLLFINGVSGGEHGEISTYFGEVTNAPADERGRTPPKDLLPKLPKQLKDLADFALDEVGKSPAEIKKDLLQKVAGEVKAKLPIDNALLKKVADFGLDEVGKSGKDIRADLIGKLKGELKDHLPDLGNQYLNKAVTFGIDHAGESTKQIRSAALGELKSEAGSILNDVPLVKELKSEGQQLLKDSPLASFGAAAAVAAALASKNATIHNLATTAMDQGAATVFNAAGDRLGLPSGVSSFLGDHAGQLAQGDWQSVATDAISQQLGGGALSDQVASVVMSKVTGQPVTSLAVKQLGAQALKALVDKAPVVASGPGGDAAVTGVTSDAGGDSVQLSNGASSTSMPHKDFVSSFPIVSTLTGLL